MLRAFLSFSLALVLVLTSQAMASARGAAAATGQMVICNGDGTRVTYTDATGAPTAPPHICPECVAAVTFCGAQLSPTVPFDLIVSAPASIEPQFIRVATNIIGWQSRAPPLFI